MPTVRCSWRCTSTRVTARRTKVSLLLHSMITAYSVAILRSFLPVDKFRISKGWKHLGIPHLISHGSQDIHGDRHRFLVIPRCGTDIWKLFLKNGRRIPEHTVYRIGLQMVSTSTDCEVHDCKFISGKGCKLCPYLTIMVSNYIDWPVSGTIYLSGRPTPCP